MKENRDPGLAAVFSFIYNGLGQIYNGQIKKGLFIISVTTLCIMIIIFGGILSVYALYYKLVPSGILLLGAVLLIVGIFGAVVVGTYSIYDAYDPKE